MRTWVNKMLRTNWYIGCDFSRRKKNTIKTTFFANWFFFSFPFLNLFFLCVEFWRWWLHFDEPAFSFLFALTISVSLQCYRNVFPDCSTVIWYKIVSECQMDVLATWTTTVPAPNVSTVLVLLEWWVVLQLAKVLQKVEPIIIRRRRKIFWI